MNTKNPQKKGLGASNGVNMKTDIYNTQGKKVGTLEAPENIFGVQWNDSLMHQVVTGMQANARPNVAHAKTRGEVRGGGKKPWRQKGTGRARHGSSRSPIWKGGGVTHGPRNDKDYTRTIPKKMRAKALFMALSSKMRDNEIIFVDSFGFDTPKTAAAKKSIVALSAHFKKLDKKKNAALIALSDGNTIAAKSFRNMGNIATIPLRDLNPVAVLTSTYVIMENPEAGIAVLSRRLAKKDSSNA